MHGFANYSECISTPIYTLYNFRIICFLYLSLLPLYHFWKEPTPWPGWISSSPVANQLFVSHRGFYYSPQCLKRLLLSLSFHHFPFPLNIKLQPSSQRHAILPFNHHHQQQQQLALLLRQSDNGFPLALEANKKEWLLANDRINSGAQYPRALLQLTHKSFSITTSGHSTSSLTHWLMFILYPSIHPRPIYQKSGVKFRKILI